MPSEHNDLRQSRKGARQRRAVLALVLAILAVLAVAVTANAYVAKLTETTLVDFDSGTFRFTGLLDLPGEGIDSVQLMPVGLAGDWQTANQILPERLANVSAVAAGNRIYVVGGTDNELDFRSEVYSYDVGPDGELSAPQTQASLLEGRAATSFTVHDPSGATPVLYVVGGFDENWSARDTIYRATIDPSSGTVSTWVEDSQKLPTEPYGLQSASAVVHDDSLYVIGGWGGENGEPVDTVYHAPIGASGALGEFVETWPLPEPLYSGVAIVYEGETLDTLYFIGGRNDGASTFKVYFADFLEGGGLTPWTLSEGNLPNHIYGHAGVYLRGEIVLIGGVVDSLNLEEGISSIVKVALVDPTNTTFRLYDWCENAPPDCTIGAWQTGELLPEVRALHAAATVGDYIYVLGGQDGDAHVRDTIYYGSVDGSEAVYATEGTYISDQIDLGQRAKLLELEWDTTISRPDEMSLTMQYRYSLNGLDWVDGPDPVQSVDGTNRIEIVGQPEDVVYFQYEANLTTSATTASPLLNSVHLYYEVPDPDLAVIKDTGKVITVSLGSTLVYTITYTNNGGWVAEDAELTEYLPENTTFGGSAGWQQVGDSNAYTYQLGNVPWGEGGTVPFEVVVNSEVPPNTTHITNEVKIDYPPMIDAYDQTIVDPFTEDNEYKFSNPLGLQVDLTIGDPVWPAMSLEGMWPQICISVINTGAANALQGFWVELYIKPAPSEPPQWPSDHDWGYCLYDSDPECTTLHRPSYVGYIDQLLAGEDPREVCLIPEAPVDPLAPDYPAVGTYDVYAQVDVAFAGDDLYLGRYSEGNETNNLAQGTLTVMPSDTSIYLPVILRGAP